MAETQAASSPAETPDVFQGQQPTMAEYDSYRRSGELPERFKPAEPAESAPADAPEETADDPVPDSEPEEAQEQPQKPVSPAEKRIKQLLAENKELKRQQAARQDATPDSSPARPQQPQNYQEYRATFKPSQYIEDYAKAHPDASYEDANAAMADHLLDVRDHFKGIETRVTAEKQALESKVSEARERYENFDEIKDSFLAKTLSPTGAPLIPIDVLSSINDSDMLADLLYVIGGDEKTLSDFIALAKADPRKAIKRIGWFESQIAEQVAAKPKETPERGEDGKFKAPEKRQTSAPKPPVPVSGGTSRGFDVNDDSLSNEDWMRKRNQQLGKA